MKKIFLILTLIFILFISGCFIATLETAKVLKPKEWSIDAGLDCNPVSVDNPKYINYNTFIKGRFGLKYRLEIKSMFYTDIEEFLDKSDEFDAGIGIGIKHQFKKFKKLKNVYSAIGLDIFFLFGDEPWFSINPYYIISFSLWRFEPYIVGKIQYYYLIGYYILQLGIKYNITKKIFIGIEASGFLEHVYGENIYPWFGLAINIGLNFDFKKK